MDKSVLLDGKITTSEHNRTYQEKSIPVCKTLPVSRINLCEQDQTKLEKSNPVQNLTFCKVDKGKL